jgi:hypothetical protein
MQRFLLLLLLLPSLAWGAGPSDSYVTFPASGATGYIKDNAALEPGANDFIIGVRFKRFRDSYGTNEVFAGKYAAAGNQESFILYVNATDNRPAFYIDKAGTGAGTNIAAPVAVTVLKNENITLVGRYQNEGDGSSLMGLWKNGTMINYSATAQAPIFDSSAVLSIGNDGSGAFPLNAQVYEVFYIIGADLSGVSGVQFKHWHNNPGVSDWMKAGTLYYLGGKGARSWPEGVWREETGKGSAFDLKFTPSQKVPYSLWKPLTIMDLEKDKLSHWKRGLVP